MYLSTYLIIVMPQTTWCENNKSIRQHIDLFYTEYLFSEQLLIVHKTPI